MGPSAKPSFAKQIPLRFRRLISGHHPIRGSLDGAEERESLLGGGSPFKATDHRQPSQTRFEIVGPPTPNADVSTLPQRYVQMAQDLQPSLPSLCRQINPADLELLSKHPIAAGSFADILEVTYKGHKFMLKAYRCYFSFDVTQIVAVRSNDSRRW